MTSSLDTTEAEARVVPRGMPIRLDAVSTPPAPHVARYGPRVVHVLVTRAQWEGAAVSEVLQGELGVPGGFARALMAFGAVQMLEQKVLRQHHLSIHLHLLECQCQQETVGQQAQAELST